LNNYCSCIVSIVLSPCCNFCSLSVNWFSLLSNHYIARVLQFYIGYTAHWDQVAINTFTLE
jgi:hypothetical protein